MTLVLGLLALVAVLGFVGWMAVKHSVFFHRWRLARHWLRWVRSHPTFLGHRRVRK